MKKNIMKKLLLSAILSFSLGVSSTISYGLENIPDVYPKRELRSAWIATVYNIDWPSQKRLSVDVQKKEFVQMIKNLKNMGINAIIVQIRPTSDSFYPSEYVPWSEFLTGTQGVDPGYDPLKFMVEEAHKNNMEFHAWFNPYRISTKNNLDSLSLDHPARKNPDWVISYGNKLYYDPGNPEARQFIVNGVLEVVKNYDIDAVQFDDYFYPYKIAGQDFPDEKSYKAYGEGVYLNKDTWRRNNVNTFVREIYDGIKSEKNWVKFGISPFGIWRNASVDPTGSNTNGGHTSYDSLYADTRYWINTHTIDYIAPQIYWNFGFTPAPYETLVNWWSNEVNNKNVHLYIGQAAYKVNKWQNSEEMANQSLYNLQFPQVQGSMFFSAKQLIKNPKGISDTYKKHVYKYPALIPTMPWIDNIPPSAPNSLYISRENLGVCIYWESKDYDDVSYYALYRVQGDSLTNLDIQNPKNLIGTVRKDPNSNFQFFMDKEAENKDYTYVITALDRLHNESTISNILTINRDEDGIFTLE
ncbi:MAG: family 10 glycosylhydrolase [Anaeromicrobium sp.]|jgi:uncharacterized lipoprotein YddW (UPF0748 family)|uniref:glycoside hydrolase family 10 protein n=1 Tax=Anaeromicrobium sp. TaxID=1929132 RepID=UPI0025D1C9B8|nr:family 10 glycosylhydrolase [Anaeromicrobium sp.]MCT4595841.1 family 10 glycosylhydrolase [Anaeromicrobium sp.]